MNNNEWPLSVTKAEYPLSISIIDEDIRETGLKIKISFSHFEADLVYFFIYFETPAGTLLVEPKKHSSYCVIHDMDKFIDLISGWLKDDSRKIDIRSNGGIFWMELNGTTYYNDMGIRLYHKETIFFTMFLDTAKKRTDTTSESCFSIFLRVNEKSLEELIEFFKGIIRLHKLYKIESPELFNF